MQAIRGPARPEPPLAGDENATVVGFLEHHRATLAWKCAGLDIDALRATVPPSTMTLGGLLKHLAFVEDYWFSVILWGNPPAPPWASVDWTVDPDWDWESAERDTEHELRDLWEHAVDRSRDLLASALDEDGLGQLARGSRRGGEVPSLRWILVHKVEEYARHNGHADLLREAVDGATGDERSHDARVES